MKKETIESFHGALDGIGARIRMLRRQRNMTQAQLAEAVGIRTGPMNMLERGHHLPSLPVLYRLAEVFDVSLDFLTGKDAPPEAGGMYVAELPAGQQAGRVRRHTRQAHIVRIDPAGRRLDSATIRMLDRLTAVFLSLEDICGAQKRASIPLSLAMPQTEAGLGYLAGRVRNLLGVNDAVIFDYLELFENTGLRVLFVGLPDDVESVSCYDAASQNAFIFVSVGMNVERQLFRLACELGRIYFHTGGAKSVMKTGGGRLDSEHAARRFAAFFLMPEEAVHATVRQLGIRPEGWTWELLLRIKHRFGVSAESLLYRLGELNLIEKDTQSALKTRIYAHYEDTKYSEPDFSRRILTPNGRLGDLLISATMRPDFAEELAGLRWTLTDYGVTAP